MDILFSNSAKRTLRRMISKGLIKLEDLDTPPDGWFLAMGYERETGTGTVSYTHLTLPTIYSV